MSINPTASGSMTKSMFIGLLALVWTTISAILDFWLGHKFRSESCETDCETEKPTKPKQRAKRLLTAWMEVPRYIYSHYCNKVIFVYSFQQVIFMSSIGFNRKVTWKNLGQLHQRRINCWCICGRKRSELHVQRGATQHSAVILEKWHVECVRALVECQRPWGELGQA